MTVSLAPSLTQVLVQLRRAHHEALELKAPSQMRIVLRFPSPASIIRDRLVFEAAIRQGTVADHRYPATRSR